MESSLPLAFSARMMSAASSTVTLMGFSKRTLTPALSASMVHCACAVL